MVFFVQSVSCCFPMMGSGNGSVCVCFGSEKVQKVSKGLKRLQKVKLGSVGCCLGTTRKNLEFSGQIDIMKIICSRLQSQMPKRAL